MRARSRKSWTRSTRAAVDQQRARRGIRRPPVLHREPRPPPGGRPRDRARGGQQQVRAPLPGHGTRGPERTAGNSRTSGQPTSTRRGRAAKEPAGSPTATEPFSRDSVLFGSSLWLPRLRARGPGHAPGSTDYENRLDRDSERHAASAWGPLPQFGFAAPGGGAGSPRCPRVRLRPCPQQRSDPAYRHKGAREAHRFANAGKTPSN